MSLHHPAAGALGPEDHHHGDPNAGDVAEATPAHDPRHDGKPAHFHRGGWVRNFWPLDPAPAVLPLYLTHREASMLLGCVRAAREGSGHVDPVRAAGFERWMMGAGEDDQILASLTTALAELAMSLERTAPVGDGG